MPRPAGGLSLRRGHRLDMPEAWPNRTRFAYVEEYSCQWSGHDIALLLPLMAAAGGHHGGGHGPRGYRNVDQWLQSLPEEQQVKARAILEEARPAIEDTRWRIRQKREELAHFDYAEDSSAETLSRLGWELQDLRDRLRLQLAQLEGRLLDEVGVSFRRAGKSRGCNSMIRQDVIHTYSLQETLEPCP